MSRLLEQVASTQKMVLDDDTLDQITSVEQAMAILNKYKEKKSKKKSKKEKKEKKDKVQAQGEVHPF